MDRNYYGLDISQLPCLGKYHAHSKHPTDRTYTDLWRHKTQYQIATWKTCIFQPCPHRAVKTHFDKKLKYHTPDPNQIARQVLRYPFLYTLYDDDELGIIFPERWDENTVLTAVKDWYTDHGRTVPPLLPGQLGYLTQPQGSEGPPPSDPSTSCEEVLADPPFKRR